MAYWKLRFNFADLKQNSASINIDIPNAVGFGGTEFDILKPLAVAGQSALAALSDAPVGYTLALIEPLSVIGMDETVSVKNHMTINWFLDKVLANGSRSTYTHRVPAPVAGITVDFDNVDPANGLVDAWATALENLQTAGARFSQGDNIDFTLGTAANGIKSGDWGSSRAT